MDELSAVTLLQGFYEHFTRSGSPFMEFLTILLIMYGMTFISCCALVMAHEMPKLRQERPIAFILGGMFVTLYLAASAELLWHYYA